MTPPAISCRLYKVDGRRVWGRLSLYERKLRLWYVGLGHAGERRILLAEIRSVMWDRRRNLVLRLANGTTYKLGVASAGLIKPELERLRRRLSVRITRLI